jgi:DNA-binding GntR family transcriptional regulator
MRAALDRMRKGVEEREWAMALEAHVDFHLDLIHACGEPALDMMLKPIEEVIMVSSLPAERGKDTLWEVDGHFPILDALIAGDPDAVEQAMKRHFEYIDTDQYREFRSMPFGRADDIATYREYLVEPWRAAATTGA